MNGLPRPSSPSCWKPLRFPRLNSVSIAAARLYPEQVQQWRQACILGQQSARALQQAEKAQSKADKKRIRQLEQELRRKDKALAEAAALLILQKSSMPTGATSTRPIDLVARAAAIRCMVARSA